MKKIEVIFGPPGTGKTSEIVKRVKEHLDKNYLFCSFTRAAAKEGLERIGGEPDRARTIHSIAYEQVGVTKEQVVDDAKFREFARITGYPMRPKLVIISSPCSPAGTGSRVSGFKTSTIKSYLLSPSVTIIGSLTSSSRGELAA